MPWGSLKDLLDKFWDLGRLDFLQFCGDEEGGEADQLQAVALQRLDREEPVDQAEKDRQICSRCFQIILQINCAED